MNPQSEILTWTFLLLGAAISLFAFVRILTNGFAMVLWAVMLVIGLFSIDHGLKTPPPTLVKLGISKELMQRTGGLIQPSRNLSETALADLCHTLEGSTNTQSIPDRTQTTGAIHNSSGKDKNIH